MRISDWSSDVCSSDLPAAAQRADAVEHHDGLIGGWVSWIRRAQASPRSGSVARTAAARLRPRTCSALPPRPRGSTRRRTARSEEHTSELQALMRDSYAVFCLKKKKTTRLKHYKHHYI